MSLLKSLGRLLGSKSDAAPASADTPKDNRGYERFPLRGDGHVTLSLTGGGDGAVREASYCALGVEIAPGKAGFALQDGKARGQLTLLGQSVACVLKPVRTSYAGGTPFTAFLLLHETPESLIFLRALLEPLRRGSSMVPIDAAVIHERYKGAAWLCLRGDGPTDLVARREPGTAKLEEALLTYRSGEHYVELAFEDGKLRTRRSLDTTGDASRMAGSGQVDMAAVRFAACMYFGLSAELREVLAPMQEACLAALGLGAVRGALPKAG